MRCNNCGREMDNNAAFCNYCGVQLNNTPKSNTVIEKMNDYAQIVVPRSVLKKYPRFNALLLVGIFVAVILVGIITVAIVTHGGHDLEGTYRCNENMMFTSFTFDTDGTVYASYSGVDGAIYKGTYKKSLGKYEIHLTEHNMTGGSSLSQYYNDNVDDMYNITAKKTGDDTLEIAIGGKLAYIEYYATYYKY